MKKILLTFLLCFTVVFAMFAIDMSPHPSDILETIFTMQDNVVISQVVLTPANVLYFESFNIFSENEICVSAEANDDALNPYYFLDSLSASDAIAVSYIGYEMGMINLYKPGEDVAIYKTEFG